MSPQPWPKPPAKREPRERKKLKRVRVKAYNAKRKGSKFPKRRDTAYTDWVRAQPCIIRRRHGWDWDWDEAWRDFHRCCGDVQVCHIRTRGAGGMDRDNVVPMCALAHDQQHALGIPAFEIRWGVDLKDIAHRLTAQYEAEKFPCP